MLDFVARKKDPLSSATFWSSPNFTYALGEPHHRSWPYERDKLERLAHKAGLDDEELRDLLGREIARRQREDPCTPRAPTP